MKKKFPEAPRDGPKKSAPPTAKALFPSPVEQKEYIRCINGKEISLTNAQKVFWPEEGYTKGDVLEYYNSFAAYIIPYLKNRPESLHCFPDGVDEPSFCRKKNHMLCNDRASLLYMANLGSIEMNPWSSTIRRPAHPTWCIIDIDPDKSNTFEQVIETVKAIFLSLLWVGALIL